MDVSPLPDRTRREGVRSFPIKLVDGRRWGLALPSVRLRPAVEIGIDPLGRPTETIRVAAELGYPLEIRRLVADLRASCDGDEAGRRFEALFSLAVALLRRAHDLTATEAASLLELESDDLPALVETVLAVVTGECPGDPKEYVDA